METQGVISVLMGIVLAGVGWWVKNIWAMVMDQQRTIAMLQVELAKSYMPRAEIEKTLERIFDKLDEIQKGVSAKTGVR